METTRVPSEHCALSAHGIQEQGGGGCLGTKKEMGGHPPKQTRTPFVCGLIYEMGGNPQDLISPPPPPHTARQSEGGGARGEDQQGTRFKEGAPPPLGGKGTLEEQARSIVAQIVNFLRGAAHLVAKPWHPHNGPESEDPEDGAAEEGGEGSAEEAGEEGRGETQGGKAEYPPPPPVEEPTNRRRATRPQEVE